MKGLPSIEALESVHDFPTDFIFKVFGFSHSDFEETVVGIARSVAGESASVQSSLRESSKGKHVCVTLNVSVRNAQMVHGVYKALAGHTMVTFLF